jgi:hypothetical protein
MDYSNPPNHYICLGNKNCILSNHTISICEILNKVMDNHFVNIKLITNENNVNIKNLFDTEKIAKVFISNKEITKCSDNNYSGNVAFTLILFERNDGSFVLIDMCYNVNDNEILDGNYRCKLYYSYTWTFILDNYECYCESNILFEYMYGIPIKIPLINWIKSQNIVYDTKIIPPLQNLYGINFASLQDIFQIFINVWSDKLESYKNQDIQLSINSSNMEIMSHCELLNSKNFLKIFYYKFTKSSVLLIIERTDGIFVFFEFNYNILDESGTGKYRGTLNYSNDWNLFWRECLTSDSRDMMKCYEKISLLKMINPLLPELNNYISDYLKLLYDI